jgi:hypothetical protein
MTIIRSGTRAFAILSLLILAACSGGGDSTSQSTTPTGPNTPTTPAASVVATVAIGGTLTLQAGATTLLTATPKDASGNVVAGQAVTWSSSDPTLMSVGVDGTVNATRIGTVTITATIAGTKGSADVTSALAPFTFVFSGTSAADAQIVRDGVQEAARFFKQTFNRTMQNATTITASTTDATCQQRAGNTAYTVAGAVTICTASPGWTTMGPNMKEKIVVHENFHLLQNEVRWIGGVPTPTWLIEGSAELMGFGGMADVGTIPLTMARSCNIKEWSDFLTRGNPPMPPLSALETNQAWNTVNGPSYDPAFLAADYLTTNAPGGAGLTSFVTFWTAIAAGTAWPTAFQAAFGQTSAAFYAAFPGYSGTLLASPPATYLCGGL